MQDLEHLDKKQKRAGKGLRNVVSGQRSKDLGAAERYFHHTLSSREKTVICTDAKMYLFHEGESLFSKAIVSFLEIGNSTTGLGGHLFISTYFTICKKYV